VDGQLESRLGELVQNWFWGDRSLSSFLIVSISMSISIAIFFFG
jgi:hypothetical protein